MKRFFAGAVALACFAAGAWAGTVPSAPFNECPAIGQNSSCAILLWVDSTGTVNVLADSSQGPYDGSDDTLVGVLNNSNSVVLSIPLSSTTDIFGFENDGLCTVSGAPSGCPFGSTGYEGPGVTFTNISNGGDSGTVNFAGGIAAGGTAYFSLEDTLTASQITPGNPGTGGPSGGPGGAVPEPASMALMALGGAGLMLFRKVRSC